MDQRARDAIKIGDKLFEKKAQVDSLHQEIALQFAPHLADFTSKHNEGDEFADHLFSSYPPLACRELTNVVSAYLYSRSQKRFSIHVGDDELDNGDAEREFLEYITDIQWRAMYDAPAQLARALKETAQHFVPFGNAVLKFGPNSAGDGLFFKNYHLRDNAWSENAEGKIDCNHRNWEPSARQLKHHFAKTISKDVERALKKDPEKTFKCRHIVMPSRLYEYKNEAGREFPFVSLYIENESETVLEEIGLNYFCYNIPRWNTISGSQYGISMATSIVLPDGRTQQVVVRTLREAGEKYTDPPMLAFGDAVRGDFALMAGGVTILDADYMDRKHEAVSPIAQEKGGFPIAFEVAAALREDIRSGFFLDKIQIPDTTHAKTAYEIRALIEQHIRAQTPIFDPIEEQFAPLYEGVFEVMREAGAFPMQDMPETIAGADIRFSFFSPLSDLAEQREAETFVDVRDRILFPVAQLDPAQLEQVDWVEATRDAMKAGGWKQKWFKPKEAVAERQEQLAKQAELARGAEALAAAGEIAEQGGKGIKELGEAGIV